MIPTYKTVTESRTESTELYLYEEDGLFYELLTGKYIGKVDDAADFHKEIEAFKNKGKAFSCRLKLDRMCPDADDTSRAGENRENDIFYILVSCGGAGCYRDSFGTYHGPGYSSKFIASWASATAALEWLKRREPSRNRIAPAIDEYFDKWKRKYQFKINKECRQEEAQTEAQRKDDINNDELNRILDARDQHKHS